MNDTESYYGATEEECAMFISEALCNLSKDYPHDGRAAYAYGRLILGKLGLQSMDILTFMPDKEHPYIRQEIQGR